LIDLELAAKFTVLHDQSRVILSGGLNADMWRKPSEGSLLTQWMWPAELMETWEKERSLMAAFIGVPWEPVKIPEGLCQCFNWPARIDSKIKAKIKFRPKHFSFDFKTKADRNTAKMKMQKVFRGGLLSAYSQLFIHPRP